jgi:glycosyltransferase involved in cell wall biosynthesis
VAIEAPLMERYHRHLIKHCSLGLWHGDDCFRAYAPWCRESHLVHDIHTKEGDRIGPDALERKLADVRSAEVLELVYAGRLDPMKAPLEWLQALAAARKAGARFRATWFGEGPMLEAAKAEASRLHLNDIVHHAGFLSDRGELLERVRQAHAFVFTHVTPESPRNLLEALVSGTPLLGYQNSYAQDLIDQRGGGALVPIHDANALGQLIAEVASDRERLASLTTQAALNGQRFTDAAVFAERSALIKQFA